MSHYFLENELAKTFIKDYVKLEDDVYVKEWNKEKSVELSENYDLAILATPHDYIDLKKLGSVPILDTRSSI